jgi:hypothetical protein
MKQRADTRKAFESYLDGIGLSLSSEEWIIGGKDRSRSLYYGRMLRKHDPIAFEVGYKGN